MQTGGPELVVHLLRPALKLRQPSQSRDHMFAYSKVFVSNYIFPLNSSLTNSLVRHIYLS